MLLYILVRCLDEADTHKLVGKVTHAQDVVRVKSEIEFISFIFSHKEECRYIGTSMIAW